MEKATCKTTMAEQIFRLDSFEVIRQMSNRTSVFKGLIFKSTCGECALYKTFIWTMYAQTEQNYALELLVKSHKIEETNLK